MILLAQSASATANADIVIVHRFTGTMCAGLCVDETVTVSFDGRVTWNLHDASWPNEGRPLEFQVSREAVAAFAKRMDDAKPKSDRVDHSGCDAADHVPGAWDWEIQWNSPAPPRHLLTCDRSTFVQQTWWKAIEALGMPHGIVGDHGPGVRRLSPTAPAAPPSTYASRDAIEAAAQTCGISLDNVEFGRDEMGDFADPSQHPTMPWSGKVLQCMLEWSIENNARFGLFLEPDKRSVGSGTNTDITLLADGARACGIRSYRDALDWETTMLLIRRYEPSSKINCLKGWIAANPLASVTYQPL
ncbi:MAG TPA: hypothetical protein VJ859_02805 [Allosphingosinicella sp.]|nr:hypothetical protein [Allosphingosinicella sp.]